MNNRRPIIFIFSFSLILMGLLLMQRNMKPNIPVNDDGEQVTQTENQDDAPESEAGKDPAETPGKSADDESASTPDNDEAENSAISAAKPEQFLTLGSLDANATDRMMVTLTTHGGSIKRIESNFRKKRKNRLAYRDYEYEGGYLGELELENTIVGAEGEDPGKTGLKVHVVGPGTPAALAGIQIGDSIVSIDDEPVITPADFGRQLLKLKPNDSVTLGVYRNGAEQKIAVNLAVKPIEIIRPEPDTFETGNPSPESFLLNLSVPKGSNWSLIDPGMTNSNWDFQQTTKDGSPAIEFSYVISNAKMKAAGLTGSIKVKRLYWLPIVSEDDRFDLSSRTSHVKTQISIENIADVEQEVAFELSGPTGTPTEGWWYINKIHGRSTAIGSIAGTRDVAGSSAYQKYKFFGGPEIASNVNDTSPIIQNVFESNIPEMQEMKFIGVDTQYFNVSLLPSDSEANSEMPYRCFSAMAAISGSKVPKKDKKLQRLVDCTFLLFDRVKLAPGKEYSQEFDIFAGPKEPKLLAAYGLEDNRTFGWFAMFSKPLCWLLKFFYTITGQVSFGLAIILLTVLVRSLMIPISRKAAINAQMMQALQPQMKEIADKYKDDMEKRAQAQRDLFKRHKYNPFGGCLLMFFQLPIFIGLYRGLSVDIALRDQPLVPGMNWCSNLAAPDQLFYWEQYLPAFLGGETGYLGPYFNLLPMFTIVLFLIQQKMFTPPATDDNQKMMQKMMTFMMFFMGILFFKVPAALCLYFITSSLWGIIERKMLPKPQLSKDKLDELGASTSSDSDSSESDSSTPKKAGLFAQIKDAVEQNASGKKGKAPSLSAEEKKRVDRERKKKLKNRGN